MATWSRAFWRDRFFAACGLADSNPPCRSGFKRWGRSPTCRAFGRSATCPTRVGSHFVVAPRSPPLDGLRRASHRRQFRTTEETSYLDVELRSGAVVVIV